MTQSAIPIPDAACIYRKDTVLMNRRLKIWCDYRYWYQRWLYLWREGRGDWCAQRQDD